MTVVKFRKINGVSHPSYLVVLDLKVDGDHVLARIEQRDGWELPKRPRWTITWLGVSSPRVKGTRELVTYEDTRAAALETVELAVVSACDSSLPLVA